MKTKQVKVHYIGRGVYNEKKFIKEAEEIGVSRAFPLYMIKKMNSNQRIYLAQYTRTGEKDFINPKTRVCGETRTQKNVGDAKIFGYFFVGGLNLPAKIMDEVRKKIPTSEPVEHGGGQPVARQCGNYIIVSSCTTTASLQEIVEALEEVIKEKRKKNPKFKFKTMVTGRFVKLSKPIIKKEEIFCRTLRTMEIPIMTEGLTLDDSKTELSGIKDYEHIAYYPKGSKVVGSN